MTILRWTQTETQNFKQEGETPQWSPQSLCFSGVLNLCPRGFITDHSRSSWELSSLWEVNTTGQRRCDNEMQPWLGSTDLRGSTRRSSSGGNVLAGWWLCLPARLLLVETTTGGKETSHQPENEDNTTKMRQKILQIFIIKSQPLIWACGTSGPSQKDLKWMDGTLNN